MTYPNPGVLKAAMGHYLTESARTALEAMEPEEDVIEMGPGKQMPAVGPNQILDMPLFTKIPFLPGSNTMFYTTNLGEKLYQPSATFDLSDPYCKIMAPKYKSLHDPHLRAYYKRKDNLRRLKKSGQITDKNKVVCSLKEFNEYRQYLTSLKLEFEKHYMREQKMLEKQVTKLQDSHVLPEAAETSKYRDWLLKEERPTIQEQENVMRNRYLELINQELEKLEQLAEENRRLTLAQDDKKKQGLEKRKQLLLRKKMEEEWRKKEMTLLMKIGDDVKREARIEEQRRKSKEDKLKRKQVVLEKKMAYHLMKLQDRFQKEGLLPPFFATASLENQSLTDKKEGSFSRKSSEDVSDPMELEKTSFSLPDKETEFSKEDMTEPMSLVSLSKGKSDVKSTILTSSERNPSKFAASTEQGTSLEKDLHQKGSLDLEPGESIPPPAGSSKVSFTSAKDVVSMTSSAVSNKPSVNPGSGMAGNSKDKVPASPSAACASNDGAASCGSAGCGSKVSCSGSAGCRSKVSCSGSAGCGNKTSCCGSAGCGSKTSCCGLASCGSKTSCSRSAGCGSKTSCSGSVGCGSKTSCCGSAGCGSKTSCCESAGCGSKACGSARCGSKTSCGLARCGSKTSCCGSAGCGSKTSCCGSAGCGSKTSCCGSGCGLGGSSSNSGKTACCGSAGCGSSNGKAGGGYDSSGSSKHGTSSSTNKLPFSSSSGANPSHRTALKPSAKISTYSAAFQHAVNEGSCKVKQKKKATLMSEPESQPHERNTEKKRRLNKGKIEHMATTSQEREDCESSYSAYFQRLLSTSDQSALQESLKGKEALLKGTGVSHPEFGKEVSSSELNSIIQNIMTWVVSAVTSILYPALTKFEERVRTRVYTISEESVVSSENSSSCTSCNEDFYEGCGGLPTFATRKVSFTNTSIKPTTSSPSEFHSTSGKPVSTSLLSSKSSFTSFTKSTHMSIDSDIFKGKFKRGKTAVYFSPSKHNGLLSTTASMRSSKSDSHISQMQKSSTDDPENVSTSYHSRRKHKVPKELLSKTETTMTTDTEQLPFAGGEHRPSNCSTHQRETIDVKDLKSIFCDLKLPLAKVTAVILDDIFKKILGDLGCTACSVSISMEVLLESISDSLLGSHSAEPPVAGSVSRVASFVANDIVENVLSKLHSTAQKKYFETISKDDFSTEWKAMCIAATEKYAVPDPTFWRAQMPLSFDSVFGIAEEIVQIIIDKLKVFALSSQTKVSQFELFSKIKAIGIPLEQLYAAVPPHTVESEAANAIVKDTIRKIVSKTVASSETNILQYVEEMIGSILSYIQCQMMSPERIIPTRESSVLIQLINDVFNDLSTEKLRILSPSARSSSCPKMQRQPPSHEISTAPETPATAVTMTTLFTAEKNTRKPFPPVNVPGMVIYSEAELEEKEKRDQDGRLRVNKEQKITYEGFGLESRQRSRSRPKSAFQDDGEFLDKDVDVQLKHMEKTESSLDNLVQDAIFCSIESQQTTTFPTDPELKTKQQAIAHEWTLEQALKKMEEDFKGEEQLRIIEIVQNLLKETFQHVWAEQRIWPPTPTPSSLAHVSISRQQAEEQPTSKGQSEFTGQILISDTEVHGFAGDLVKAVFQFLSHAAQNDLQGIRNRPSSLVFTDILPLNVPTEAGKGLPTVHFRVPEKSFDSGFPQEEVQSSTKPMHDPKHISQTEHPSKSDLANDLVQTFIAKLESFVISKVESQLCLDVQNLKMSISSDFSSALQEEFKRILANQHGGLPNCLEDIFNSYNNSILAAKEKPEQAVSLSYSNLKSYASDVARMIVKNLKHGLDKEVDKISTPPVIFSESIAATQIVGMVLTIFAPQEHHSEAQTPLSRKESVLEKVFRKNPTYKRDLQSQIQNTVETFLNEIYQTIMLNMDGSGMGELWVPKAADDSTKKALPTPAVVKSDASLVSNDLVDIVFEDLSSGLAAALNMKGAFSTRLQSLLYDFVQKTVEPLAQLTERGSKAGHKSRFPDLRRSKHQVLGLSKAEKASGRKMGEFSAKQLPDIKDFSPEGIAKYLVDNIFLRLEMFVEDKLESELGMAAKQEKQCLLESGYATSSAQRATEVKASNCRDKAKLAVQDSQYNLRLCAEKLTCTILKVIQKDLEREMLSCKNLLPYEENASANEIMNDLLKIIAVQIALTENEIQKRVLKRIFKKQQPGQHGSFPLLSRVEDVLNQVTQRIMEDLGHLPSFNNDSIFLSSESKSSAYNGMMDTVSQINAGNVAGEIVDGILNKMYSVVVDTLFTSGVSKLETNNSSSNKGSSNIQKITLAVSQLQPSPQSLSEELVQSVLNKIACFAASNLEEVLPLSVQQRWKYDMKAGSNTINRPSAISDDSESSLLKETLSKSDLTVYAKDVVSKVLGTIIDEFKTEDYHRTIYQVNTLSSEQISKASDLIHSVVQDLHTDDVQITHMHKHTSLKRSQIDGLPSTQMFFQFEMTTKDIHGKPKGLFYEDYACFLNQVLPKESILREIFEQQPLTDANVNETLKILQVAENIVSEVFMRTRDLEPSVCILKKIPGELSERLFCYGFKSVDGPRLLHSDSQTEIGSVARDIVASVFENVHKCLLCSVPASPDKYSFLGRKDQAVPKGSAKILKHQFTQPEFPFYNVSLKNAMDIIDKIAKETVECIVLILETFVARHFKRDFKCNFLEIVKSPLESLSFAQLTRSLDSLSTHVANVAETTVEAFQNKLQGDTGKGTLPTLGSTHNFLDFTKLGGAVTRECIETAIQQVQMLHSELNVYANNAVSSILEIIKHTLDRELTHKDVNLFSSSSETLVLSETISVMLDHCNESLTEITSELMVENLQLEMSGRAFAKDKALAQNQFKSPRMKTTSKMYRRVDMRDSFPPINVPGMVIYSEEESEVQEEVPSKFPSVFKYSEWDAHVAPERQKCRSRPPRRRRQDRGQFKLDFLEEDWLPRQSSIPEGSILEKLFKKTADFEATPRQTGMGHQNKAGLLPHHESFARKCPYAIPESTCYSALCPLKLGHTAETIVNTLLYEFGVENEPMVQSSYCEKFRQLSPLKEKSHLRSSGSSVFVEPKQKRQSLLNRWKIRLSDSSEKTMTEESYFMLDSSSLLSKWESKQHIFKCKSPERHKDLELLACAHVPDPCEIHLLANHIVLNVIKELIIFQSRDTLDEVSYRSSLPAWKQEVIQSESKWLQDRIWRNSYLPSSRKQSSCLDVFWEPLTHAVLSNVLYSISSPSARHKMEERNEFFERSLSMFCSVDACCPEHGLRGPKTPPVNIEELAFHISEVIINSLCERNILQESISRKGFQTRRSRKIFVPPLCLADFDDVYHPLVKEVSKLLSLEIEMRSRYASQGKIGDSLSQQHLISSPCFSRASRGDCRGSSDVKRTSCLSTVGQIGLKNRRLNNVASNLDSFIRSLKTSESKNIVNKVLHIILDSLWPDQSHNDFGGSVPDAQSQNMMPYQNANRSTKRQLLYSSMCPHAYKLSNDILNSNLGLSPKSVVLLDVVSEKLIRALLDKCLLTDHFTGTFAFDDFPENEQLHDMRKCVCDDEVLPYSHKEMKAHEVDSSTSLFTYNVKYTEEPWVEAQSGVSSCESALDVLAHTLVKPVMTELSFSIEHPGQMKTYSKKTVEFTKPASRKGHGQAFNKKHACYSKSEMCSSSRGRKSESRGSTPGKRQMRKSARERNRSVLEAAIQRRPAAPTSRPAAKKPLSTSCKKKSYRREMVTVTDHGDHHQLQPVFSAIYSALFLEDIVSQLLIKIFSSLQNKYDQDSCINLHEMNTLFVNALMEEFKKAGVGVLQRAEEKAYFPLVDSQTVSKIADSILREFGFQLAAEGDMGRDIDILAERAAEIILTEILDYQLPPAVYRRLPQSAFRYVKPGPIIQKIERCVCFPRVKRSRPPPPAYITILSQKYLERVINRLLTQLFPPTEGTTCNQDKREMSEIDFNELCSYIIKQVMRSISKHKIWVAKKDDRCCLHSEKEIQNMVDAVYRNMLKMSGSQLSIQKDVECRNTAFVDCMTSFIIQEVTNHHLQTFLSKGEEPLGNPDPEALSENIVRTVLDSISEPSMSCTEVFPAKFLEEIVSRVLSKIFCVSGDKKKMTKGQHEIELGKVAKRMASSINLQFGRASVTGVQKGEEQSLGAPLSDVMDEVIDSVYNNIVRERQMTPEGDFSLIRKNVIYENVKRLIEKGISDNLLHPLFSGDLSRPLPVLQKEVSDAVRDKEFHEDESWSPFSTLLSSGFLKDLITGLLTRIFPSTSPRDTSSPWNKKLLSEADLNKLSNQLLCDVRMKLLKHEIRVTKDTHPEQYEYSEEDVQNMTDSLCSKIIQKSGSLEAAQRDVKNKNNILIDRIAGFLVGDILQQHVQPFVSREETSGWDRAAAGDSMGGLEIYRTAIKPLDLREEIERKQKSSPTSFLGNIISELFSKISDTLSEISPSASREEVGDAAVRLAKSVTKELAKAHFNVQEGPEEPLGSPPEDTNIVDQNSPYKDSTESFLSKKDPEDERNASPCQTATIKFEEAVDHLLQSACPSSVLEANCLIQENLMVDQHGPQMKPSVSPYITVLSYPVLEAIIDRLLARIFPSSSNTAASSDKGEGPFGFELQDRIAQVKMDIMAIILKQAIWTSTYGSEKETDISEEAIENMVESVYCDVLHEVLLQQPFPEDREILRNLYVTQIACFIINEMFKHHLQSLTPEDPPSYVNHGARNIPDSGVTVFPCRVLENMLNQLLEKIFPNPESIAAYIGKHDDVFSETDFTEMAANLKCYIITEISAHEIKLENVSERIPDMDQETEEDIATSVYNQILQKYQSQGELQNTLMVQGNGTVREIAQLLIREILNFHLHPFLSSNDSSSEYSKWQKEGQQFSRRIYSALFLEDVVVAFFCKILSSPNILAYSKDINLSEDEMRNLVIELVNALVNDFKMSEVKVIQGAEEDVCLPQIGAEKVIEISNSIYEKLLQQFGTEFEIFKAFQKNICMLAEKLAPIIIRDISGYQLLPMFTGDTSSYLFSFLEAETIVDRVETLLPEPTSSGSVFGEMFVKILHRIFPSWLPDSTPPSPDPTVSEEGKRSPPISYLKEEPSSVASKSIQNIVQNICKTVYVKSGSPNRKQESTAEELMEAGFLSKTKQGYHSPKSKSPLRQSHLSSALSSKTAGWTIHHVRLGEGEPQLTQLENGSDTYSASFLKDIFSGLISKLLTSTASVCLLEKQGAEAEPSLKHLIESILKEFAKSPVKVLQLPEGGKTFPNVEKTEIAKIIHASLCSILQDQRSGVPICMDKENGHMLAEKLVSAIKKEILGYQIQEVQAKTFQDPASKPFEFGEMAKKVFTEVKKISTPSQIATPCPFLVSQRFIHDVLAFLLSKILPLPTKRSTSTDTEDQCAEFDFIHMKLLSNVMAEISKNNNAEVKYLDRVQPNRVVSQTVANSIYNSLLPEFGSTSVVEKCIRTGCTILLERIVDIVIKEISGNQMQTYFTEELNRQQQAIEAEKALEDQYGADPEPSEGQTPLQSHLKGLSSLILEEVAVKLLTKIFSSLPLDEVDTRSVASMKEVARKIINSLQSLLSNSKLNVWQHDDSEYLASEDSRTVGEVVDSVYTDILKHSNSETSLYEDLTNSNEEFVNRVACFMVSEISKRDFQPVFDSEAELLSPSVIKLESEKIVKKFLSDMEGGKEMEKSSGTQIPVVPVAFLEEILSRFLTTILLAQYDLGIHQKKSLSKTDVNEIVGLLKTSVEKEMSKNKINLVASDNQPVLDPQYEEMVNQVVHSVINNVLEKSGSQKELYNDMTTNQVIFPEQVASIIINEISSCSLGKSLHENSENETLSALELDRIVGKVLAQVNSHMELEEDVSLLGLSSLSELPDGFTPSSLEELPVKIIPYIGHRPLKIDPDIISDHLAVLSIKTEPLEKLKKTCLSKMGVSLTELRRASASGKSFSSQLGAHPAPEANKRKERRPSLDMAGRLGVRPREAVCRNSFQSLTKPDITKVELLKDVESKQDLIICLVAHDIDDHNYPPRQALDDTDSDEEEQVLTEHKSFFFEVPAFHPQHESTVTSQSSLHKSLTAKASSWKRSGLSSSNLSSISGKGGLPRDKKDDSPLPSLPLANRVHEAVASSPCSPVTETGQSTPRKSLQPSVQSAQATKSDEKGASIEKAVVGMHLSRDTEETAAIEITSVYQDKNINVPDAVSETRTEVEDGKVISTTSPEGGIPPRQRSSVFEKVSTALSRVFSRTSASNLTPPAAGQEKPPGD